MAPNTPNRLEDWGRVGGVAAGRDPVRVVESVLEGAPCWRLSRWLTCYQSRPGASPRTRPHLQEVDGCCISGCARVVERPVPFHHSYGLARIGRIVSVRLEASRSTGDPTWHNGRAGTSHQETMNQDGPTECCGCEVVSVRRRSRGGIARAPRVTSGRIVKAKHGRLGREEILGSRPHWSRGNGGAAG